MSESANNFNLGSWNSASKELLFILGPCVMESPEFTQKMAASLSKIAEQLNIKWLFKASYDKANRTSGSSFRGPGAAEGAALLGEISQEYGVAVTTDVHRPAEVALLAPHVDLLQVPAFLCRQTDLVLECARSGRAVNIKKGQFLAPWDVDPIAEKLEGAGCDNYFFTERGSTFGYNSLVVDMRSLAWMREKGHRVIFDATHSVQQPGGLGGSTGGDRKMAPVLARAAVAAGCDAVFIETHENPDQALSDGPNQIALTELPELIESLLTIHQALQPQKEILT